jgi:hypothetical protein
MNHSPGPWNWGYYDDQDLIEPEALCQRNGSRIGVFSDHLSEDDAKLIAAAPRMREMLLKLEWAGGDPPGGGCPECGDAHAQRPKAHRPDCELASLLEPLR